MNIVDVGGALFLASATSAASPPHPASAAGPAAAVESSSAVSAASVVAADAAAAAATSPPADATSPTADAAAPPESKRAYPAPAEIPTQKGPKGIRFDFNDGCRVLLPEGQHPWKVRLSDIDTGNILFETEIRAGRVNSTKRYFVRVRLEIWAKSESVLRHDYSAAGRDVLIQLPVGTLGDPIGWFPYAIKFKEQHQCRLTCLMGDKLIPLFRNAYPDITLATEEEVKPERYYATYCIGRSSMTRISSTSPATFAVSACTAPPAISLASTRPRRRPASNLRMTAGRLPSPMSASRCRARPRANTGTIRAAGGNRASPQG